jgi:manganese/iron transport system substrate-binding protein
MNKQARFICQQRPLPLVITSVSASFALLLGGCATEPSPSTDGDSRPLVVATSTIIADLSQQVGGNEIALEGLLNPGDDPHVYEPVPTDTVALERADLILYNGYNLEPGLIRLINATGTAKTLAVGEVVSPLELDKAGASVPDPHIWGDVANVVLMVDAIEQALIELSPEDATVFEQNSDRLTQTLERLDAWVEQQVATIPADQRYLVTTHDAFQYYARAYGLKVSGTLIGISTEEQPSAQTVQTLIESVKATGVSAIFAETTLNPSLIETVAEEANVVLAETALYSDAIGAQGSNAETYVKMVVSNTKTIVEALGGTYTAFEEAAQ